MRHKWTTPNSLNKSRKVCENCGCVKISNYKGFTGKIQYIDSPGNHYDFAPSCTGKKQETP